MFIIIRSENIDIKTRFVGEDYDGQLGQASMRSIEGSSKLRPAELYSWYVLYRVSMMKRAVAATPMAR